MPSGIRGSRNYRSAPSGSLNGNVVTDTNDFVSFIYVYQGGVVIEQFVLVENGVGADDYDVVSRRVAGSSAVDRNDTGSVGRTDGVCREPGAIVYVVDLDLLVFPYARPVQQCSIDRTRAFVFEFRLRYTCPV